MYHGRGSLVCANGDGYEGEFSEGRYHGEGEFTWGDGHGRYTGTYRRGKPHGQGVRLFSNGNKYSGTFVEGARAGEGVMSFASGDVYVGTTVDNQFHGSGVLTYAYGDRYEGSWKRGVPCGRGKYTWSDGGFYEGDYLNTSRSYLHGASFPKLDGKRHGRGTRVWVSGNKYEGEWVEDKPEGEGVLTFATGEQYVGQFSNGREHGLGVRTFGSATGDPYVCPLGHTHKSWRRENPVFSRYDGQFADGYMHGTGVLKCPDGREYRGMFRRGKRHGQGTQHLIPDINKGDPERMFVGGQSSLYRPSVYSGGWQDGWRCGSAQLQFQDGTLWTWEGGKQRVGFPDLHEKATVTFPSGRRRGAHFLHGHLLRWVAEADDRENQGYNKLLAAGLVPTTKVAEVD